MPPPRTLVGRQIEVERLTAALGLDGASAGTGAVVLSGDAGIGKSRLVAQLIEQAVAADWLTVVGHGVGQAGGSLAFAPFVELLGQLAAALPDVTAEVVSRHPALEHFLTGREPVAPDGAQAGHGNPVAASADLVATGVAALIEAAGGTRPLLVVIEDAHWIDVSSRDLLTVLLTRGLGDHVALLVTYRSDDLHRRHPLHETLVVWDRIPSVARLALKPLPDNDVAAIAAAMADEPLASDTLDRIAARAEGNPFFAEELATAASRGRLEVAGGLSRVLSSRIEALADTTQQLLRTIAISGGPVGHDLLERVVDLTPAEIDTALAEAVDRHVLVAAWPPVYTFRHALLAEVVADSVMPAERRRLHRAYAAALSGDHSLGSAAELARHAAAAGDLETAVAASRAAARGAMTLGGSKDALEHLERALCWLPDREPERDAVTLEAAEAARAGGDILRAVDLIRDQLAVPGPVLSAPDRARLLAAYANGLRILDVDVDTDVLELTNQALALVPDGPDEARLDVLVAHLQQLIDHSRIEQATAAADEAIALSDKLGRAGVVLEVRTILTSALDTGKDLREAEAHLRDLARTVPESQPVRIRVAYQLAALAHRRGDLGDALAQFDTAARLARGQGRPWTPWGLEGRLLGGLVAYEIGDWDGALRRLTLGAADSDDPPPPLGAACLRAATFAVNAARGIPVAPAGFAELRRWWRIDGLTVVLVLGPEIEILGRTADLTEVVATLQDGLDIIERMWGEPLALMRLATLLTGQAADRLAAHRELSDPATTERLLDDIDALIERAAALGRELVAGTVVPDGREPTEDDLAESRRESWAWILRLRAERARWQWLRRLEESGARGGAKRVAEEEIEESDAALVTAWEQSVAAFERYGHTYETARSRARLAWALSITGAGERARLEADRAEQTARELGAAPLLEQLAALRPAATKSPTPGSSPGAALTPRESEVLVLVARGRTNGQIGRELYISTKTASVHVSNILAKLGAASRTEAAAIARDRGLLD